MPRTWSITLSAGLLLLGSLFILLMGTAFLGVALGFPRERSMPGIEYFLYLLPLVMLGLTVWGITTAIELFRLQPWSRVSALIIGGLLAFFGLTSAPFAFLLPHFLPTEGVPPTMRSAFVGVGFFYAGVGLLGGWWVYLFTRRPVMERFVAPEPAPVSGPARPLSITVIAWYLLVAGVLFPVVLLMDAPAALLTVVVTGWKATLINGLYAVVLVSLGIGLLRGIPWSRTAGVCYFVFTVVHMGVFTFFPGREERWAALMSSQPAESQAMMAWMQDAFAWALLPGVALTAGIAIWFLVTRKEAFLTYAAARRSEGRPMVN